MKLENVRKSTHSDDRDCVEVGRGVLNGEIMAGIQDTKQRAQGDDRDQVVVDGVKYAAFITAVRSGRFDWY